MTSKQMYFVQVFGRNEKGGLIPGQRYTASDAITVRTKAEHLALRATGAVAFSQMVDVAAEDAEEPVVLATYGRVSLDVEVVDK